MPTSQQHTRANLEELKAQIIKKIGAKRTDKYFGHLCDLFSQKLTKVEFEKLCCLTIGKENIGLNNQLILSIVKNAYLSVVPERLRVPSKSIKRVWGKPNSSLISNAGFLPSSSRSNGDPSARSPCKTGSRIRDRKVHDRRLTTTTFPPHVNSHRVDSSAPHGVRVDLSEPYLKRASLVKAKTLPSVTKALENGDLENHDLSRPLQLGPASSTAELPEAEALPQSKRPRLEILASPEQVSGDKVGIGVVDVGNEELVKEVELVNGDSSARLPCKTGSRICHRKVHDRRLTTTTFSPNVNSHRADSSAKKGVRVDLSEPCLKRAGLVKARTLPSVTKALENGDLKNHDLSRPLQLGPASSTAELPEAEALPQSKRPRLEILASSEQVSGDQVGIGVVDVGNEELVKEVDISIDKRLSAPLGIPFRSGSLGFARRSPCSLLSDGQLAKEQGCLDNSELPTTKSLRRWMEQLAESIGLQGVSEDSANVLNHGLDALLKRLIKSCIYLKGRPGQENEMLYRQRPCTLSQEIVSVKHSNPQRMSNACIATDTAHMESCRQPFSFIDFKTAMELNPEQLGGLRPLWMEKIYVQIL